MNKVAVEIIDSPDDGGFYATVYEAHDASNELHTTEVHSERIRAQAAAERFAIENKLKIVLWI